MERFHFLIRRRRIEIPTWQIYIHTREEASMKEIDFVTTNMLPFLEFFKSKFPVFHLSNVFRRDLEYSLRNYLHLNGFSLPEVELETASDALISKMVSDGILKPVANGTWTLTYPEFRTKTPGKPVQSKETRL